MHWMNPALAYRLYLTGMRAIACLRPVRFKYWAACVWARVASPRRSERELVMRQMDTCASELSRGTDQAWQDYLWHVGANTLNTYLYSSMGRDWVGSGIEVCGQEHLQAALDKGTGVLVLTAHQHSMMQLAVTLGLLNLQTHPILMDPGLTVPNYLEEFAARAVRDSSAHYNGGGYLYVDYSGAFVRPVYRALQAG